MIKYNEITKIFNYQDKIIEIVVNNRRSYFVPLCRIDSQFHEEIRIRFKKIMRDQIKKKKSELSERILDWDEVKQYFKSGQQEYAIECGENLIKSIKGEYPLNYSLLATSLIDMANLYEKQKNYKEAVTQLKQALSIREKMFGINNPKTLEVFEMLASVPKY